MARRSVVIVVVIVTMCLAASFLTAFRQQSTSYMPAPVSRELQEIDDLPPIAAPQQPPSCEAPLDHVFFLKTHKCGSSTVQNILMRRGLARGLNFVLPERANYLGHPDLFTPDHIGSSVQLPDDSQQYDVFTHHSRYHSENVRRVLPEDTRRVTILREPAALFESLFNYYDLRQLFDGRTLDELLSLHIDKLREVFSSARRLAGRVGYNQMAFDMGLGKNSFSDQYSIQTLLQMVDRDFHLVMISEHMEASLLLLADLMCWPIEDVAFVTLNARPDKLRAQLTKEQLDKLHLVNNVDFELYKYFTQHFKTRVQRYGLRRMEEDIDRLISINQRLIDECVSVVVEPKADTKAYPVKTYKVRDNAPPHCKYLTMDELRFTEVIRKHQISRFKSIKRLQDLMSS